MKLFIVFTLCIIYGLVKSEELTKESIMVTANHCQEETGATDDDVTAMFNHGPAASTEAKCLKACVMKKFGVLNDDGKLMEDATITLATAIIGDDDKKTLITEIIHQCHDITVNEDHCEAAVEYGSCLYEHAKEKGLIPLDL